MIISLIFGAILGAVLVIFALQNVAMVTVTLFTWQLTGSLALVLLATVVSSVIVTLLILLPGLIKDDFTLAALKRQKKEAEGELAQTRQALAEERARRDEPQTVPVEKPAV